MSDSKSLPTGSSRDSDDHSGKTAGKKPERSKTHDDTASTPVNRPLETTVVLGNDTKNPSANPTVSLNGTGKAGEGSADHKDVARGDNARSADEPIGDQTMALDRDPKSTPPRRSDPMPTMVIGEKEDVRDLIADKPPSEQEIQEKKKDKEPEHKRTVSLDRDPPASRQSDDPMPTMVIGDNADLREVVAGKAKFEEESERERPKTASLDRDPPGNAGANDPNQTLIIGENEDLRDLISEKNQPDKPGPSKTVSLDRNPPPSRGSNKPSRGDTLSLDTSDDAPVAGQPRSNQNATPTTVLGQGGATGTPVQGAGGQTMPLDTGNAPQRPESRRDASGTMILGSNSDSPPPSNAPQDPRSKTVVLGNQGNTPRASQGMSGNRTVPLDGSSDPPQRTGVPTAVLGNTGDAVASRDERTKTVVLEQGQSSRQQESGHRTVPLNEIGERDEKHHPATERAVTEPIHPTKENVAYPPFVSPSGEGQPVARAGQGSARAIPLRASSLMDAPRAGETRQAQLLRRTTSALAFASLAIVISILCATLSSSAVSITYACSVLSLFVGMFSFWRYTRLLRQLGTTNYWQ